MKLSSRADVSAEDHRCDSCGDKGRRETERETEGEGRRQGGRDEELLLLLSGGLKKEEGCVHYRRDCSPGAVGHQTVTTNHLCMSVPKCVYAHACKHTHTHTHRFR